MATAPTQASVSHFLAGIKNDQRRADCVALAKLMQRVTGRKPRMWGPSIVGFGEYHYRYDTGREGDWFELGFSPRKDSLSIYVVPGLDPFAKQLAKLGKHKRAVSCLYVKQLDDVDARALEALLRDAVKALRARKVARAPA